MSQEKVRHTVRWWGVRGVGIVLVALSLIAWSATVASARGVAQPSYGRSGSRFVIRGHTVPSLKKVSPSGRMDGSRALDLSIALNLRNADALSALIAAQNDPNSGLYHRYLTPSEFTERFGPTQATVDQVVAYLRSQGIVVGAVAPNRLLIDARGSVAAVERAFGVRINTYRVKGRTVYAPAGDPSVPSSLANVILNVGGLDNAGVYHRSSSLAAGPKAGSGPGGGYTPSELRTAYDMNSLVSSYNGSGQTVAIFELDGYTASDVNAYLSYYGLGSAKYSNVLVDGATNTAGAGAIEVELDMEVVSAIAPGATQKIYIGPNSTQGVNDTYNRIVTDNIAKVTSISWGLCERDSGNSELQALDNIFAQGAAQGQAFFSASGDSGAYDCNDSSLAVDSPAGDPNVVGVGGTNLSTGSGGSYSGETVWSCTTCTSRSPKGSGGGGGLSTYFAKPSYQTGPGTTNSYSNGKRQVPDVAADADPASGYSVYCTVTAAGCSSSSAWISVGGTSAAAPLWAGIAADTNQYLAAQGKPVLGNANAKLYQLFNTTQTYPAYHDVTSGNNLYYPATSGYDQASGIGTPDVWNLARDAAGTGSGGGGNDFSISANPSSLSIAQGGSGASTIGTAVTSGSAATVSLTASVSPSGPPASLSPTSVTAGGSSTLTVTVGSTVATGSYTVTVTGTEGSVQHSTTVSVTVTSSGGGGTTTQKLVNPGFESGQSPWQESSAGGYQLIDPTNPHTGSYSAWLCGYNGCSDAIWQTVTLPSTTTKVVLKYWVYISTNESGSTCYDYLRVRLRTSSGSTISTVQTKCNANATNSWVQYSFDVTSTLSAYKGQQVQVYFLGTTDSSLTSNFFVDDVELNVTA